MFLPNLASFAKNAMDVDATTGDADPAYVRLGNPFFTSEDVLSKTEALPQHLLSRMTQCHIVEDVLTTNINNLSVPKDIAKYLIEVSIDASSK